MKKALKVIFISVVSLCLIAIVAGYIALTQIDFNNYKSMIVKVVRDTTGRELTLGDIQVKASFNPTIEIKNVTFSNAQWAKNPLMVSADSIDLSFAIIPLLQKNVEIDVLEIHDAVVNLEESATGEKNWEFEKVGTELNVEQQQAYRFSLIKTAQASENDSMSFLSSMIVKRVAMENVKINIFDKSDKLDSYDISYLNIDENSGKNIEFKFDVNNGLYQGNGVVGAFNQLASKEGFPVKVSINAMGIQVDADAKLFNLFDDISFNGNVKVAGFLGKDSQYNESANINIVGDLNEIKTDINSLNVAGNIVAGSATIVLKNEIPVVNMQLNSEKIDIASFEKKVQTTLDFSIVRSALATTLVSSEAIPYNLLRMVNVDATVNIAKVVNKSAVVAKDLQLLALLNNGKANINLTKGTVAGGNVTAKSVVNAADKTVNMTLDASKLNLAELIKSLNVDSTAFNFISGSDTDVHVKLMGTGNTYASLVDSLDGQVVAIVNKSEMRLGNIGMMKGNIISQLFNTLKIAKENDNLNLSCAVVRADLKSGKATFPNGLVLNADKFTLVADGNINLRNDKISLSVKPFAGSLTDTNLAKALSSLVKLSGTLQKPVIGVDGANAIKTIVGVTTTGPAYLGAQMLLENNGSPCYTALENTGYENMFPKPDNVVKSTAGDVGQVLDDSVGLVKDTTEGIFNLLSGGVKKVNKAK